jgi:hypothetical protein
MFIIDITDGCTAVGSSIIITISAVKLYLCSGCKLNLGFIHCIHKCPVYCPLDAGFKYAAAAVSAEFLFSIISFSLTYRALIGLPP